MAKTIDERIVKMTFDNSNFNKNAKEALSVLDKFKSSFDFKEQEDNFKSLEKAASKLDMGGVNDAVDNLKLSFSAMEVAAITAISNITTKAMQAGTSLIKSLSVDQITAGWNKFNEAITAEQTIMSAVEGKTNPITGELYDMDAVLKRIEKLQVYADETSYSMGQMTTAIGSFTGAGIDLDVATEAIEGIANACAYAGVSTQKAESAFTGFSKAIGSGKLSLGTWNMQLKTSGLTNSEKFRQSLIDAGVAMGTLAKNGDKVTTSLKGTEVTAGTLESTLGEDWATTEVMLKALQEYSDTTNSILDYSEGIDITGEAFDTLRQKMKETGKTVSDLGLDKSFNTASSAIQALEKAYKSLGIEAPKSLKALSKAQEAVTFGQAIDSIKEAVSSGWAKTFELIFGNYEEAKSLWTNLANEMWNWFASEAYIRNSILEKWHSGLSEFDKFNYIDEDHTKSQEYLDSLSEKIEKLKENDKLNITIKTDEKTKELFNNILTRDIEKIGETASGIVSSSISGIFSKDETKEIAKLNAEYEKLIENTDDEIKKKELELEKYKKIGEYVKTQDIFQNVYSHFDKDAMADNSFLDEYKRIQEALKSDNPLEEMSKLVEQSNNVFSNNFNNIERIYTSILASEDSSSELLKSWEKIHEINKDTNLSVEDRNNLLQKEYNLIAKTIIESNNFNADEIAANEKKLEFAEKFYSAIEARDNTQLKDLISQDSTEALKLIGDVPESIANAKKELDSLPIDKFTTEINKIEESLKSEGKTLEDLNKEDKDRYDQLVKTKELLSSNDKEGLIKLFSDEDNNQLLEILSGKYSIDISDPNSKLEYLDNYTEILSIQKEIARIKEDDTLSDYEKEWALQNQNDLLYDKVQLLNDINDKQLKETELSNNLLEYLTGTKSGYTILMETIKIGLSNITKIIDTIREAWSNVFPKKSALVLIDTTEKIKAFVESLTPSEEKLSKIRDFLVSIFTIVKSLGSILKQTFTGLVLPIIERIKPIFSDLAKIFQNVFGLLGTKSKELSSNTEGIAKVFERLLKIIDPVINTFKFIIERIREFTDSFNKASDSVEGSSTSFSLLQVVLKVIEKLVTSVSTGVTKVVDLIKKGVDGLKVVFDKAKDIFANVRDGISNFLNQNGSNIGNIAGGGILGYFILNLTGLIKKLKNLDLKDLKSKTGIMGAINNISDSISGVFKGLKTSLEEFTNAKIKTDMIKTTAQALLELAIALAIVSSIDSDKLWQAVGVMTALAGVMLGFMEVMTLMQKTSGGINTISKGLKITSKGLSKTSSGDMYSGVVKIAAGFVLLAAALKILSGIDIKSLATSVGALVIVMGVLFLFIKGLAKIDKKGSKSVKNVSKSLGAIGFALIEIAAALKILSTINIAQMGVALLGLVVTLAALFGFLVGVDKLAGKSSAIKMAAIGAAVVGIGLGLLEMAAVLKILGSMKIEDLLTGLLGILGTLGIVFGFVVGISKLAGSITTNSILGYSDKFAVISASMVLLGASLLEMAAALKIMGTMSVGDVGTALLAIGGIVAIMGLMTALLGMTTDGLGVAMFAGMAASMILLGDGIIKLAEALAIISLLDPKTVGNSIGYLCGALASVLGIATGFSLVSPLLLLFAVALTALGAACVVFGKGMKFLAEGLILMQLLGDTIGTTLLDVILGLTKSLVAAVPVMIVGFAKGIIDSMGYILEVVVQLITTVCDAIVQSTPKIVEALVAMIKGALTAITEVVPEIVSTIVAILSSIIEAIRIVFPELVQLGWDMLTAFLSGIADNLGQVIDLMAQIVSTMVEGFLTNIPVLVDGFMQGLINCINGLADSIRNNAEGFGEAVANLCGAIVEGIVTGIGTAIIDIPGNLLEGLGNGLTSLWNRLTGNDDDDEVSDNNVAVGEQIVTEVETGISNKTPEILKQADELGTDSAAAMEDAETAKASGQSTIDGLLSSLMSEANLSSILEAGKAAGAKYMEGYNSMMNIQSPSKEMMKSGKFTIEGLLLGLESQSSKIEESAKNAAGNMLSAVKNAVNAAVDIAGEDLNPVISPVLDLSNIESQAGAIDGILGNQSISSMGQLNSIQNRAASGSVNSGNVNNVKLSVNFNVNNNGNNLDEETISKFSDIIVDKINEDLGFLM